MPGDKLRVGIIGANVKRGWGASAHIPALKALPEFELAAVCTAHQETAEESAQAFGARLAFHDYHAMVTHPDIDIVTVAVRVPFHHELTTAALQAGKHVYTEWPLGATLAEAQDLANLARAKGVQTMVGLQGRASPTYQYLKELVDGGYVGRVMTVNLTAFTASGVDRTSDRVWAAGRAAGVGTFTIAFGHAIDALTFALGDLTEVAGVVSTQLPTWHITDLNKDIEATAPDTALLNGRLTGGAVVSAHMASVPWHGTGLTLRVFGTDGTLVCTGPQTTRGKLQGAKGTDAALQDMPVPAAHNWVPGDTPDGAPYNVAQMYRRFGEAIRTGSAAEPGFDHAVKLHKLLSALETSSSEGVRVDPRTV